MTPFSVPFESSTLAEDGLTHEVDGLATMTLENPDEEIELITEIGQELEADEFNENLTEGLGPKETKNNGWCCCHRLQLIVNDFMTNSKAAPKMRDLRKVCILRLVYFISTFFSEFS